MCLKKKTRTSGRMRFKGGERYISGRQTHTWITVSRSLGSGAKRSSRCAMLEVYKIRETLRSAVMGGALMPGWFGDTALVGSYWPRDQMILVEFWRSSGVYLYLVRSCWGEGVESLYWASQPATAFADASIGYCRPKKAWRQKKDTQAVVTRVCDMGQRQSTSTSVKFRGLKLWHSTLGRVRRAGGSGEHTKMVPLGTSGRASMGKYLPMRDGG
jgi:hypothetical protein